MWHAKENALPLLSMLSIGSGIEGVSITGIAGGLDLELSHSDGIYNLLYSDKMALKGPKPKTVDDFQLSISFG